jgi:hypothetical protein
MCIRKEFTKCYGRDKKRNTLAIYLKINYLLILPTKKPYTGIAALRVA